MIRHAFVGTPAAARHCFLPTEGHQMTVLAKEDSSASPADSLIFQHLGTAVMLCWTELPLKAQEQILNQANDMIGVAPVRGIRDRIIGLLLRHRKL
jgi:hypothetical protein